MGHPCSYVRLRSDILAGRLPADGKLKIQDLAQYLKASPSVVREALSRLSAESLVIAESQRGFRVAPINAADVSDLTAVRIDIELKCMHRAMKLGGLKWEAAIVAADHELSHTPHDIHDLGGDWRSHTRDSMPPWWRPATAPLAQAILGRLLPVRSNAFLMLPPVKSSGS